MDDARRQRIERALEGHGTTDPRVNLPWKDENQTFRVVKVPLSDVLLNPRSHRIQADLESHDQAEAVRDDPWSTEAQTIISDLLSSQDGFDDLRRNLEQEGQREHGVITRNGCLVNANRRAVALRQIDSIDYIAVAVLPADAGPTEIDRLELKLQMRVDFHAEYSFTNILLFVEDLIISHGFDATRVATELRWATSSSEADIRKGREEVEQHLRILGYIRELQKRCNWKLKLNRFDNAKQSLVDLDSSYTARVKQSNPDAARRLQTARFAAILTGLHYRKARLVDEDFVEEWLFEVLAEHELLGRYAAHLTTIGIAESESASFSGAHLLEDETVDQPEASPIPLLDALVEANKSGHYTTPDEIPMEIERAQFEKMLFSVFENAADECKEADRTKNELERPSAHLKQAQKTIARAEKALDKVRDRPGFNKGEFQIQAKRVLRKATELKSQADSL